MTDSSLGGHKGQAWQSLIDLVDPKGLDLVDPKGLPWFCTDEFENRMCSCIELSKIAEGVHVHVCMHDPETQDSYRYIECVCHHIHAQCTLYVCGML